MDNAQNRRADDKRAPGQLQWGESGYAIPAGAALVGTIAAAPVLTPEIVMHGLLITKDGITYNGETVKDAGTVHAALLAVLIGERKLAAPASADNPSTAGADGKHAWFAIDILGNPMREYQPGKWENCIWPSTCVAAPVAQSTADAAKGGITEIERRGLEALCDRIEDENEGLMLVSVNAAAAIRKLLTAPALNPSEVPQWISFEDRLPEAEVDVIVHALVPGFGDHFAVAGLFHGDWMSNDTEDDLRFTPTHWMPLPAAPAASKEGDQAATDGASHG